MVNPVPRTLAGRYEVGELIGRGGMAEVHIGHDNRLGRTVAIKILRSDLARDPSFQARFRREAQAAASLNHPAIVAVYDTGEDTITEPTGAVSHVPFIVMEYVEGHTVRDILKDGSAVPIEEAIEITAGVLSALEYSHHAGIVHRDIKPANVMLTPTGAVKVMDFGIARAVADSAATMTQTHSVIGTAQYLSPEQARGETVDARSDLYSTGCLLYELLTGRPPFVGDSPVAVAYQHVRELPAAPSALAPDVPTALDQITLRALAKDRNDRYSNAAEFRAALEAAARGEAPVPAPTAAYTPVPVPPVDPQATQVITPQAPATQAMPAFSPGGSGIPGASGVPGVPGQSPTPLPWQEQPSELATMEDDEDEDSGKKKLIWTLVAVGIVAVLAIIAMMLLNQGDKASPEAHFPDLTGLTQAEAEQKLKADGFTTTPDVSTERNDTIEEGKFVSANFDANDLVPVDAAIKLVFSAGPNATTVPNVKGMTQEEARAALEKAGLKVGSVETEDVPKAAQGEATRTDPAADEQVASGSSVVLYLATGMVELPDLRGMSMDDAKAAIDKLGLRYNVGEKITGESDYEEGQVGEQSPAAGLVSTDASVTIREVAPPEEAEPQKVQVPNVLNLDLESAKAMMSAQGLIVSNVEQRNDDTVPAGRVIEVNPNVGTEVDTGTTVSLVVSLGPAQQQPDPSNQGDGNGNGDGNNNGDGGGN